MVYSQSDRWIVGFGDIRAEKEVARLSEDMRADLLRVTDMIEHYGLENVHAPHIKHLRNKVWEIRVRDKNGIARALYVTTTGKRIVILHVFAKKTQKTPDAALELAIKRGKELGLI